MGVGPHPLPWPDDPRYDPVLLAEGDRRNVVDRYRYWRLEAIVADLDDRRHPFHVAIENWQHDLNIGTVVRTANAFLAAEVHIVGRRRWNRRGAMVTDRYQHVRHHPDAEALSRWAAASDLPLIGVDNLPGAEPIESVLLPERCVLVFGPEGDLGVSSERADDTRLNRARDAAEDAVEPVAATEAFTTALLSDADEGVPDLVDDVVAVVIVAMLVLGAVVVLEQGIRSAKRARRRRRERAGPLS